MVSGHPNLNDSIHLENLIAISETIEPPIDSVIIITDVKNSTKAIQEGKYRIINMIGVACIAAIRNEFPPESVPYSFGGDGATFLVTKSIFPRAIEILKGVCRLAEEELGLELRVGSITIEEIKSNSGEVRYGKIQWGEEDSFFFFRGNGIGIADREIKRQYDESTQIISGNRKDANLKGLTCRIEPFLAQRGRILSILIEPRVKLQEEDQLFQSILSQLRGKGSLVRYKPIHLKTMIRKFITPNWMINAKFQSRSNHFWSRCVSSIIEIFENILGNLLIDLNIKNPFIGIPLEYSKQVLIQSDWFKLDGVLRMVGDFTEEEESLVRKILEKEFDQGKVFYGIYASEAAVMTCHLQTSQKDRHTHFIDGKGGGLTMASIQLKSQKKSFPQ